MNDNVQLYLANSEDKWINQIGMTTVSLSLNSLVNNSVEYVWDTLGRQLLYEIYYHELPILESVQINSQEE